MYLRLDSKIEKQDCVDLSHLRGCLLIKSLDMPRHVLQTRLLYVILIRSMIENAQIELHVQDQEDVGEDQVLRYRRSLSIIKTLDTIVATMHGGFFQILL